MTPSPSSALSRNHLTIGLFLAIVTVSMWVYSKDRVLYGDEVFYCYNLSNQDITPFSTEFPYQGIPINTLGDVVESLTWHYFCWNGRIVPHFIQQTFSGILPLEAFYVLNALVFGLTLYLMAYIATNRRPWKRIWVWVTIMATMMLYPNWPRVFASNNLSVNYLWPLTMGCIIWIWWVKLRDGKIKYPWWKGLLTLIAAFLMGWTHEAMVVPMCATILLWYVWHKRLPKHAEAWLVSGFVAGSLIEIFAPGNLGRFDVHAKHLDTLASPFIVALLGTFVAIAFVALYAIFWKRRPALAQHWLKERAWGGVLLLFAWAFILAIHTGTHCFGYANTVALLLVINMLIQWHPWKSVSDVATRWWAAALLLLGVHFGCTAYDQNHTDTLIHQALDRYVNAEDDLMIIPYDQFGHWWTRPWLRLRYEYQCRHTIPLLYANGQKTLQMVDQSMFDAIADSANFFVPENRLPGDGPYYWRKGMEQIVCHPDSMGRQAVVIKLQRFFVFDPDIPMKERLRCILQPQQADDEFYAVPHPTPSPIGPIQFATLPPDRRPLHVYYFHGEY